MKANESAKIKFHKIPSLEVILEKFKNIKALFFDMDGTLFDSEGHHALALQRTLSQYGSGEAATLLAEEIYRRYIGKSDPRVYEDLMRKGEIKAGTSLEIFLKRKKELLDVEIANMSAKDLLHPDMEKLIGEIQVAKNDGLKVGLVSASERQTVLSYLKGAKLDKFFEIVSTRDDCERTKPDPLPYLQAMQKMHLDPFHCLIIEDSPTGLAAAYASKAQVLEACWFSH